jgi:plasmid stability protein
MSKMIQIRRVPDALHRKLRARAARSGRSLSEYLLKEIEEVAERPTLEELFERIAHRGSVTLSEPTADAVRAERDAR